MRRSAIAVWAASAVLLGGCGPAEPMLAEVYGDSPSTNLEMSVNTCNQNPTLLIEESATKIIVAVEADEVEGSARNDCLDGAVATLAQPLGDREVIDAATGDVVVVLPLEGDEPAN